MKREQNYPTRLAANLETFTGLKCFQKPQMKLSEEYEYECNIDTFCLRLGRGTSSDLAPGSGSGEVTAG